MIRIIKFRNGIFSVDGVIYDKITTSIKDGVITVKMEKIQPYNKRVNKSTIVSSSFSLLTEK